MAKGQQNTATSKAERRFFKIELHEIEWVVADHLFTASGAAQS